MTEPLARSIPSTPPIGGFFSRAGASVADLPALIVVIMLGALGAALGKWGNLAPLGPEPVLPLLRDLYAGGFGLRITLGVVGAVAAVFLLARTDTSKLIPCALIALFSGMAGPYLVVKALTTVVSMDTTAIENSKALNAVKDAANSTVKSADLAAQLATEDKPNPSALTQATSETTEAMAKLATKSFFLIKTLPKSDAEKKDVIAKTDQPLKDALTAVSKVATVSPDKVLPVVRQVAEDAKSAGADDIATQAQHIIDNNSPAPTSLAGSTSKLYFVTPDKLTDVSLLDLQNVIRKKFPSWEPQPAVHPLKPMEAGMEVVYYKSGDDVRADQLFGSVKEYLSGKGISARGNTRKATSAKGREPSQFDLHLGPDIADALTIRATTETNPESSSSPTRSLIRPRNLRAKSRH
jgi:hypothetical protein